MIELIIDLKNLDSLRAINSKTIEIKLSDNDIISTKLNENVVMVDMFERGDRGEDGKTPIKGVDYMTIEDINEIKEGLQLDVGIEAATIEDIKRLF